MSEDPSPSAPGKSDPANPEFLIAAIGGSAGALDAFTEFLRALSPEIPLAVVLVQHLSAEHESLLVELLARVTELPVIWAANDAKIEPYRIYVLPPKSALIPKGGRFVPQTGAPSSGGIIDVFFARSPPMPDTAPWALSSRAAAVMAPME